MGLSVFCQLIEQLTFSTRDSFSLGNEKTASRTHSLTSVACGEVEYLVCEMRREPREHGEEGARRGFQLSTWVVWDDSGSRFQASQCFLSQGPQWGLTTPTLTSPPPGLGGIELACPLNSQVDMVPV